MTLNGVIMQYFHWYITPEQVLWEELKNQASDLAKAGITALWLPPAYKAMGGINDVGYGVYDLYDLGEFNQRDTVRTKYGDRTQYLEAIQSLQAQQIQVYADAVLNHKMGAEGLETVRATPFWSGDRLHPKGPRREIRAFTHFAFPGRQGKYSPFEWHWWHFDATDWDDLTKEKDTVYLLEGKQFDDYLALEKGNFDYLMGCDLDYQHEEVREQIKHWGEWYLHTTGVNGFRLDAIKHISAWFFCEWIDHLQTQSNQPLFFVGEYWYNNINALHWYVDAVGGKMSVFDVPLHYNFHYASRSGGHYDMRKILDGTMMQQRPTHAVTFVENHDSQPLQCLESPVEDWFKPLAYAIILLRREGYPCIFYADYYGAKYADKGRDGREYTITLVAHRWLIDKFLYARHHYAYGEQYDYFDHYNTIGWTRLGDATHPKAMAVIMTDGAPGWKWMEVGKPNAKFIDLTEHIQEPIYSNEAGWGQFCCKGGSVSVWVEVD
ncbi:alpha-amylase [Spirulina subsalsa FACHB-351]|uniref:Alpha-amylase n=1 Tax=Spirulina subsalsa FACHB-351 TaxID=234711 RepID=A0ABT3LB35_9CYAN|nr:alpha-amylase [Spirulina subsalsa]MCW6038721.1 alpha-amylase [Spirulina subsalsa FACHB-351]